MQFTACLFPGSLLQIEQQRFPVAAIGCDILHILLDLRHDALCLADSFRVGRNLTLRTDALFLEYGLFFLQLHDFVVELGLVQKVSIS